MSELTTKKLSTSSDPALYIFFVSWPLSSWLHIDRGFVGWPLSWRLSAHRGHPLWEWPLSWRLSAHRGRPLWEWPLSWRLSAHRGHPLWEWPLSWRLPAHRGHPMSFPRVLCCWEIGTLPAPLPGCCLLTQLAQNLAFATFGFPCS